MRMLVDKLRRRLTREREAWLQRGGHDVKRDDEMRSEGGMENARLKARRNYG
jgi:hypothetical protein